MNTLYIIRPATYDDLPRMLELRAQARSIMLQSGNLHQWDEGYPSEETLRNDIAYGVSYLVSDGNAVVGMFALIDGPDPTYLKIYDGKWTEDHTPYMVIHRIASTPESRGVFDVLMQFAKQKTCNLRIDTHRDNHIMQKLILRHGFTYCGIIYLLNGDERLAYQWIKDN